MPPKCSSLSDKELLVILQEDERDAFEEIYRRYWSLMYMHALKMLRDEDDTRDVLQDVFTSLWLNRGTIDLNSNLAGYLYTCTKNKVLDMIAKQRVRVNYLDSLSSFIEANNNRIIDTITEKELAQALENEIKQLPDKMRQIFEMRMHKHLTYKEIAAELSISDKTVKKQISNAIKIIRPKLHHLSGWAVFLVLLKK
ncbi:RNA polymerase sigma factor [Mucilaginibacter sp. BT774]|uniref:RNA polymerase sigma factor n=1 Tax=Mucilaginibacter sp. BT774 TaxID=3062276 RepID=UPI0026746AF0|nr:RNA polymerase sigma-70 factor [Mucilaginibacter sp. BT774]MDO3628245.1 RNA polymerase sigma-70 factor [Mucilaginibacter sp. BT774]